MAALLDVAPLLEMRGVAGLSHSGSGAPDFRVIVNCGYAGKGGAVMPRRGKITDHGDAMDVYFNHRMY